MPSHDNNPSEPTVIGFFDAAGNPCIDLQLRGVRQNRSGLEYQGIIDTGFSGFIQLPLSVAIALSLPIAGTTTVTLADESALTLLTCFVKTRLSQSYEVDGMAIVSTTSNEILIGMEFLTQFNQAIVVSRSKGVFLFGEDTISNILNQSRRLANCLRFQ